MRMDQSMLLKLAGSLAVMPKSIYIGIWVRIKRLGREKESIEEKENEMRITTQATNYKGQEHKAR